MENDPAFSVALDRIKKVLDEFEINLSAFVVGKDLEEETNVINIKKFIEDGNEIGNHSYSHYQNFGALNYKDIKNEIKKTDEIILTKLNTKSIGFIAPGWNTSNKVLRVLNELGYSYDHSLFSSPVLLLGLFKMVINYFKVLIFKFQKPKTYRLIDVFKRLDYFHMFLGKTKPFRSRDSYYKKSETHDGVMIYPIPSRFKLSYWFTLEFVLPKKIVDFIFKFIVNNSSFFYILIHPTDFLDSEDIKNINGAHSLERMEKDVNLKIARFIERIEYLEKQKFEFKTFSEI